MQKIIFILVLLTLSTSFTSEDEFFIDFFPEISTNKSCEGVEVITNIVINTTSTEKIKIHSFEFGNNELLITINDKEFSSNDTISLNDTEDLEFKVKFKIPKNKTNNFIKFKTNLKGFLENKIKINYGEYIIPYEAIKERKEQVINISETCQDSIKMIFPFGGTISSVSLYKDSISTNKSLKSVSYSYGGTENFLMFSRSHIGQYFVDFNSCHWGNSFWLIIK